MNIHWFLTVIFLLIGLSGTAAARTEGELAPGMTNPGYEAPPTWFKNSFLDIREDIAEATESGRRLMLYFYQDGCPYCKKLLIDNFGQAEISVKTQRYFDVVAVNLWGDSEVVDFSGQDTTEKEFSVQLRVNFTPTLLLLDEQGTVVVRINGYYAPHLFSAVLDYVGTRKERKTTVREYIATAAPSPATGRLHNSLGYRQPPFRFAEPLKTNKHLLVLFEQKQCTTCDELHLDILGRPESKELLERFDVALVNMWSEEKLQTPDGRFLTVNEWADSLGIQYSPSMVFFDEVGKEVFRTDGYLKAFHVQSTLDYVSSGAYKTQPEFQRFIEDRADKLRAQGIEVDIMK